MSHACIIRHRGRQPYALIWEQMKTFTEWRTVTTTDELWLVEHPPVFTQGQAGKPEHILNPGDIPIIQTDRGGQVTYHGPGQLVIYPLFNLARLQMGTRQFVRHLENAVIRLLADYGLVAVSKCEAPGVYVNDAKICSIGLRIRKNCAYHGLALNIDVDLEPFSRINPCGYRGLKMTRLQDLLPTINRVAIENKMIQYLILESPSAVLETGAQRLPKSNGLRQ